MNAPLLTGTEVHEALADETSPHYLTDRERDCAMAYLTGRSHRDLIVTGVEPVTLADAMTEAVTHVLRSRARDGGR